LTSMDEYYDDQYQIYSGSPNQQLSGSPKAHHSYSPKNSHSPRTNKYHHGNSPTVYNLDLTVQYNTRIGQEVHAIGSISELGSWKTNGYKLECTDSNSDINTWKTVHPIRTSERFFTYKFIVVDNKTGERVDVENGLDRIADLELLAHDSKSNNFGQRRKNMHSGLEKFVQLHDRWEQVKIRFTVFHTPNPHSNQYDDSIFLIAADQRDLVKLGPIKMQRSSRTYDWFDEKYGENVAPYETTQWISQMPPQKGINATDQADFNYHYKLVGAGA